MIDKISTFLHDKINKNAESRQISVNIGWLMGDRGITLCLSLIVGVLLARYLGPEDFGKYNYALAFVSIFSNFSSLGLNGIVVRDLVESPNEEYEILGTSFILRLIGSLLSIGLIALIVYLFMPSESRTLPLILLLSIVNIVSAFQTVSFYFEANVISKYVVKASSISHVCYFGLIALLIFFQASLIMIAFASVLQSFLTSFLVVYLYLRQKKKLSNWSFSWSRSKSLLSRSFPLILSSIGAIIYLKIDQVMLGQMTSASEVGIYSVAVRFSEVWYIFPNLIVASYFPSLLKSKERNYKEYTSRLQKMYDMLAVSALIIAVSVTMVSYPLITLLYGDVYKGSAVILSIHIWASIFIFMRALLSKWIIAENLNIFSFVTTTSGAIANVILNLFLIPSLGGRGAAIATLISYAFASYISLFFHQKTLSAAKMMSKAILFPLRCAKCKFF
jgi:O-antigen/teichoic acid export membrane protein